MSSLLLSISIETLFIKALVRLHLRLLLAVHVSLTGKQVRETLLRDFQCIPVFLPQDMGSQFEDLCHEVLKPIFHFVHPTSKSMSRSFDRSSTSWQLYCEVSNQQYSSSKAAVRQQ